VIEVIPKVLEQRLGHTRAQQRISIEQEAHHQDGIRLFGFYLSDVTIRRCLQLVGPPL